METTWSSKRKAEAAAKAKAEATARARAAASAEATAKGEATAKAAAKSRRLKQNLGPNLSKVALGMKKGKAAGNHGK